MWLGRGLAATKGVSAFGLTETQGSFLTTGTISPSNMWGRAMAKFDVEEYRLADEAKLEIVTWASGQVEYSVRITDRTTGYDHVVSFSQEVADEVAKLLPPSHDDNKPIHYMVLRGGAWRLVAGFCRSAFRDRIVPGHRSTLLGFRLAKEIKMKQYEYSFGVSRYMVLRGGAWDSDDGFCRSACRDYWLSGSRNDYLGFRIAKELKNEAV